jgi:hypothetical protein
MDPRSLKARKIEREAEDRMAIVAVKPEEEQYK